jgi:hypothetical protein
MISTEPKAWCFSHDWFCRVLRTIARKHSRLSSSAQASDLPLSLPCANFFGKNNTQLFLLSKSAYRFSSLNMEKPSLKLGFFFYNAFAVFCLTPHPPRNGPPSPPCFAGEGVNTQSRIVV